ncbi:MAG: NFACT RNA binding domain-containing protein [Planctomycetes bacterium]|nr:NFACT RNA binding domain-containing protein [Planctomycetota bacterium]
MSAQAGHADSAEIEQPAPQGLRPEEVALLIEELRPLAVGARIGKIFRLEAHEFLMRFETKRDERCLYFNVRRGFTRFHLLEETTPVPATPDEEARRLRELLSAGVITNIDQPGGDRILRIAAEVPRDERRIERWLVQELFGRGGRLIVYEGERKRLLFAAGRAGLAEGEPYRFPAPPARPSALLFPFDPKELIPPEERAHPLAFHRALATTMNRSEAVFALAERRAALERRVHVENERHAKLAKRIEDDVSRASRWQEMQRHGELLKGAMAMLRRGMREARVTDYYDAALSEIALALEPDLSPAENVERYFARARKARRGEGVLRQRLASCREDLAQLARAAELLGAAAAGAADFDEVDRILRNLAIAAKAPQAPPRRGDPAAREAERTPRRFRSREGLEILAGKNARDNDKLTFAVAHGNDLFFHRARRPGPHVILRVPRGTHASPESIEDAAFLAAYLAGWRGPGAETVHWTEVKFVRKPRGASPGKVSIAREREFLVRYRPELLAALSIAGATDEEAGKR